MMTVGRVSCLADACGRAAYIAQPLAHHARQRRPEPAEQLIARREQRRHLRALKERGPSTERRLKYLSEQRGAKQSATTSDEW